MKIPVKLPLYLGLVIFVLSILVSAVKIGEKNTVTNLTSKATNTAVLLALKHAPPNLVSVLLQSPIMVRGIDITINYDAELVSISPSLLTAGSGFVVTGGIADDSLGLFSFSAVSDKPIAEGIVATFEISPKDSTDKIWLKLITDDEKTLVIEAESGRKIIPQTEGITINI